MPRAPIHPGEHLAEELRGLNMSAAERARQPDVPVNRVTQILNGQRSVTADTAGQGRKSGSTCNSSTNAAAPARRSAPRSKSCRATPKLPDAQTASVVRYVGSPIVVQACCPSAGGSDCHRW